MADMMKLGRWVGRATVAIGLLAGATACSHATQVGQAWLGLGPQVASSPFTGARPMGRAVAVTSVYERTPALDYWSQMARSNVSQVPSRLFSNASAAPFGCALTGGLSRGSFDSSPTTAFQQFGPIEVGAAGSVLGLGSLFRGDTRSMTAQMLDGASSYGGSSFNCGYSFFLGIRLAGSDNQIPSALR